MAERKFKGVWIPADIWLEENLSLMEKCFLTEIDSLDGESGCFASNQHFAEFFNITKDSASRIIGGLVEKGYISSEITYKEGTKQVKKRVLRITPYRQKRGYPPLTNADTPPPTNAEGNNTSINNTNNTPLTPHGGKAALESSFEAFWRAYPKKNAKTACLTKWKQIHPDQNLLQIIMSALEQQKKSEQWAKDGGKYIPYPHTWLNQGRWEDEIQPQFDNLFKDVKL